MGITEQYQLFLVLKKIGKPYICIDMITWKKKVSPWDHRTPLNCVMTLTAVTINQSVSSV